METIMMEHVSLMWNTLVGWKCISIPSVKLAKVIIFSKLISPKTIFKKLNAGYIVNSE